MLSVYTPPTIDTRKPSTFVLNSYIDGEYCGQREVVGYFTLIRCYPDEGDEFIEEAIRKFGSQKLLTDGTL